MANKDFDVIIVGAGIVGLATAYHFVGAHPGKKLLVVDKEAEVAVHQTGHNSGVLHSGIYYKPGSLKARNCRDGKRAMEDFCEEESIPFELCGKVIVATRQEEIPAMQMIYERGIENGVSCRVIDRDELAELEPHAAGVAAIHVPEAGIVNYREVSKRLAERVRERGGEIALSSEVRDLRRDNDAMYVETTSGGFRSRIVVNCAGLYSDKVARMAGVKPRVSIVPFRGEYYELTPEAWHLCRNLIYPVPDPAFPFLGVHFTRMIQGGVECGPNAVLAFAREGYLMRNISPGELMETLTYPGFLRLAARHWKSGSGEMWRSVSKRAFVRALKRLVPEIEAEHLTPGHAGVRAQAVARDGSLVDDFLIDESERVINVYNAPSPAATASLNIGRYILERIERQMGR